MLGKNFLYIFYAVFYFRRITSNSQDSEFSAFLACYKFFQNRFVSFLIIYNNRRNTRNFHRNIG